MNSDLVHPASMGPAEDDAGRAVEAEPLKLGPAILSAPDSDQDGKQQSFPLLQKSLLKGKKMQVLFCSLFHNPTTKYKTYLATLQTPIL